MKNLILFIAVVLFFSFGFISCSSSISNSITFNNQSQGEIFINFRGQIINVSAGQSSKIEKIPQGTYDYATTFSIPASATSASSQGNLTGTFNVSADTKILLYYTSTLISGAYTLFVTISNSDKQNTTTTTSP